MVNYCAVCARELKNVIPKDMEDSEREYYSGTCEKCKDEEYKENFLDILTRQGIERHQFIDDRIKRYGS